MAFIPVPNVAQAELTYVWDGQTVQNVLHYSKASPWSVTHLQELGQSLQEEWSASIRSLQPTTLSLVEIRCLDLSAANAEYFNYTGGLPLAGTNASPSMPNNCALVLTKRTAMRGRSFRGRIYHPGLIDAYVTASRVNNDAVNGLVTAYTNLLGLQLLLDEALMVVVSRYNGGAPRAEGIASLVSHLTSDGVVDSQRRRLPGRGQ